MAGTNDTFIGDFRYDVEGRRIMRAVDEDTALGLGVRAGTGVRASDGVEELVFENIVTGVTRQSAEETFAPIFDIDPTSEAAPKFSVYLNSAENLGEAAGTYNRGVWMGFNAGRYLGGTFETGKQGVYMGFEDNYYDDGGDETYGVEWYTGYTTPDGTTIGPADLRPFYFRVKESDTNTADKEVLISLDVGAGPSGSLSVMGDVLTQTQLFIVHKSLGIYNRLPAFFTANSADGGPGTLKVQPESGYAQIDLVPPGAGIGTSGQYSVVTFYDEPASPQWSLAGSVDEWYIEDLANARRHIDLVPGASNTAATTTFNSTVKINGNVGFYGTAAVAKPTGVAVTAAGIHAALVTLGLIAA